jgi:two-component system alkaline phosphatase synthesis response regulator PhoP
MTNPEDKKILIVEDELAILQATKISIQNEGFEVYTAKNGKQGLDLAIAKKPDLILLDIIMPVMDGMTMLEKLREDEWGKNVEVILLTSLSDAKQVANALEKGVTDYLIKSDMDLKDVVAKVKNKLGI